MAKICVEIEFDDQTGEYSVGECEPKAEPMGANGQESEPAGGNEQTFQDVDSALQAAKDLLANPQSAAPNKDQMWNKVRAQRQMASQPGGPMMGKM
jgi:hypothetical protein